MNVGKIMNEGCIILSVTFWGKLKFLHVVNLTEKYIQSIDRLLFRLYNLWGLGLQVSVPIFRIFVLNKR